MPTCPPPEPAPDLSRVRLVADVVGYAAGVPAAQILAVARGGAPVTAARHLAMYLLSGVFAMSLQRIADVIGRDRATVAYGLRAVEDRRDDPAFDAWVEALEETLRAAPEPPPAKPVRGKTAVVPSPSQRTVLP